MPRWETAGALFCLEAFRALLRNKLRSALAGLAIMIGIAAVVCVIAIGRAGSRRAEEQLRSLGDNFVWVEAGSRGRPHRNARYQEPHPGGRRGDPARRAADEARDSERRRQLAGGLSRAKL